MDFVMRDTGRSVGSEAYSSDEIQFCQFTPTKINSHKLHDLSTKLCLTLFQLSS
jgi:hypothetical protein